MRPRFYVETYPAMSGLFRKRNCGWRWRAKAANHEILAHGEDYSNYQDMLDTLQTLFGYDVEIRKMPK